MTIADILVQCVGVVAYIIVGYSFYKKEKLQILFLQFLSNIIFGIHYFLLSGLTGAACSILSALMLISMYICEKKEVKNKKIVALVIIIVLAVISAITYENIFSIFPIIATAISAISFIFDSETFIRFVGVIAAICWLIYGAICMSYSAMVFETIIIITTIIAIIKRRDTKNAT